MRMTNTKLVKRLSLGLAGAGLLALSPASSFATQRGGIGGAQSQSPATQVEYRCYWSGGVERCTWFDDDAGPRVYGYYYGPHAQPYDYDVYAHPRRPESYHTGSNRWWKSMERSGRTGSQ